MSPDEFRLVVEKIRPFTEYIYLHVLGEPLLHPQLDEILKIAENAGLNINITTNGGLLEQKKEILLKHKIRQVNISLHDAEENIPSQNWKSYLQSVMNYASEAMQNTYVSLRLWNTTNASSTYFNEICLREIATKYDLPLNLLADKTKGNGIKLTEHVFLQRAPRFQWPEENGEQTQTEKTCYALRDHIAVLVDGEVIPCCLDANAILKLGNIFDNNLSDILNSEKSQKIRNGFLNNKITENLCKTCGFII